MSNNDTALATLNQSDIAQNNALTLERFLAGEFDLNSLPASEQLELMREVMLAEQQLEINSLPMVNSRDILGLPITIHDAIFKNIVDKKTGEEKTCVNFLCESEGGKVVVGEQEYELNGGDYFTVLKSSNAFNDVYVTFFEKMRGIARMPKRGYNFVEDKRWTTAGNAAIVLRKLAPAQAGKKAA